MFPEEDRETSTYYFIQQEYTVFTFASQFRNNNIL